MSRLNLTVVALAGAAYAQQTVKIGAIYPLSGNAASAGVHAKAAAVREMFRLMDAHPGRASRKRWTREELYAR